jgi:hypothetical protein
MLKKITALYKDSIAKVKSTGLKPPNPPLPKVGRWETYSLPGVRGRLGREFKIVLLMLLTSGFVFTSSKVKADTTLTSTNFATAYQDLDIVKSASNRNLNEQLLKALSNPNVTHDVRAAIINALGWSAEGQQNAKAYLGYIASTRNKPSSQLKLAELTPQETFALGYLLAMDNYGNPKTMLRPEGIGEVEKANAITLIDEAIAKSPKDFSVVLIRSLVQGRESQIAMDWCGVYNLVTGEIANFRGERNMRSQAVQIVMDYIKLYQEYCEKKPRS